MTGAPELSGLLPAIHEAERDGVRILWSDLPGPLIGALSFRVGYADETLPVAGITHLIEHLASSQAERDDMDANGATEFSRTVFVARGAPEAVYAHLAGVCRALADPPGARIDAEAGVIVTEAASRPSDPTSALLEFRFGLRAHGLIGQGPLVLKRYSQLGDIANAWSARYFVRQNAILCLSGAPPAELRLPLSDGTPTDSTAIEPLAQALPACFNVDSQVVAVGLIGSPEVAMGSAVSVAARRLRRRLRDEAGISYTVEDDSATLDASTVHRTVSADCTLENASAVRDAVVETLTELASSGPSTEELDGDWRRRVRELQEPDGQFGWLMYSAEDVLLGRDVPSAADYLQTRRDLAPQAVADAVADALPTAVLLLPIGVDGPGAGWHTRVEEADEPVDGRKYHLRGIGRLTSRVRLVVGDDGVSLRTHDGRWVTVRWPDVELFGHEMVGQWHEQAVVLVDREGRRLVLGTWTWADGHDLYLDLRARVPREKQVQMDTDWASS